MRRILFAVIFLFSFQLRADDIGAECEDPTAPGSLEKIADKVKQGRYKSWEDLGKYFNCFKADKSKFSENDKKAMILAGKHYNLPPALIYCLLFIESRFIEKSESPAGAQGLAQFMPDTFKGMKYMHLPPRVQDLENCTSQLQDAKVKDSVREYCFAIQARNHDSEVWADLNKDFKDAGLVPKKITYEVNNRMSGIAIGAFYINRLIKQVTDFYKMDTPDMEVVDRRVLKLAFAGYNGGPGRLAGNLARTKKKGIESAIKVAREVNETRSHMDGIEHCMSNGDGEAPSYYERQRKIKCADVIH